MDGVWTLGLANSGCDQPVAVHFDFVEASVGGTIISPAGPPTNLLANFAEDDGDLNNDQQALLVDGGFPGSDSIVVSDAASFDAGDNVAIGGPSTTPEFKVIASVSPATQTITLTTLLSSNHNANDIVATPDVLSFAFNGVADGADAYPSFVRDSLDPDGPAGPSAPVTPRARYFAEAFVANALITIYQVVIMEPGQLAAFPDLDWMTAAWGYPALTFLQDPLGPPSNSAISDFCNLTSSTRLTGRSGDNACTQLTAASPSQCFGSGAGFTFRLSSRNGCTQLRDDAPAGATSIVVQNSAGFAVGNTVAIGATGIPPAGGESRTLTSVTPVAGTTEAALGFAVGLASAHPTGDQVVRTSPARTTIDECAYIRAQNPGPSPCCGQPAGDPQSVKWRQYVVSRRDWDTNRTFPELGDGHENQLDVCFADPNPGWNPRASNSASGQDSDADGLPDPCDPNDAQFNEDQDGDQWLNRLDNCPLVANGAPGGGGGTVANTFQFDQDVALGTSVRDAGPRADDIGLDCDPNPNDINGHYHATALVKTICIGTPPPPEADDCSTSIDSDADGIANAFDNCRNVANGPNLWGPPASFAQSQRDFNADGFMDINDVAVFFSSPFGAFGGSPGAPPGYEARFDLDYDNAIDIADYSIFLEFGTGRRC